MNNRDVVGTYPLAGATNCYQRNWWASHAASKFQCYHGEYLNGVCFFEFSAQRRECMLPSGEKGDLKWLRQVQEELRVPVTIIYLGCGEEEEWHLCSSTLFVVSKECAANFNRV